ncbi:hypothetical protein B0H14DRAFT_2621661 [Mycena olivaceomarginata]|nr:hypothetical protein B0H14DRAFT_2621661 [Mycena olivaceomarginata]
MARSLGEDAAGVDFVTNIMDPGSLQRYYAPKTNVIGGMPSQRLACRVDGTWVRTYVVLLEFSVVHIPSIGSLLLLTKEEPEIRHLCGALSGGVIDELWRPFQSFGVVPIRRVTSWKWKRELCVGTIAVALADEIGAERSGDFVALSPVMRFSCFGKFRGAIAVRNYCLSVVVPATGLFRLLSLVQPYGSVEATVVGTNGLGWRSVSFARVLQRLSGIVESLATGATGSTQLQRLKLRQGSAPFRIAGQVVSSRFAVKYNALTSTDVQGVLCYYPAKAPKICGCIPGNVRIDSVPIELLLNSLELCERPILAGEDFHNLFFSVSPEYSPSSFGNRRLSNMINGAAYWADVHILLQATAHHRCGSSVLEAHSQSITTALKFSRFGKFGGSKFIPGNELHLDRKGSLPSECSLVTPVTRVGLDAQGDWILVFSGPVFKPKARPAKPWSHQVWPSHGAYTALWEVKTGHLAHSLSGRWTGRLFARLCPNWNACFGFSS